MSFDEQFPPSDIYEAVVGAHTVRTPTLLPDWAPTLAVSIASYLKFKTNAAYVADLVKIGTLFDPAWDPLTRRERLSRMLVAPIQVDDHLMSMLSPTGDATRRRGPYQKIKRVDLRPGVLHVEAPVRPWTTLEDQPTVDTHAVPLRSLVEELEDAVRHGASRTTALETRLKAVEESILSILIDGRPA